ncbi:unnamed protein product, partial [Rotaria sp. Silwood1]
MKCSWKSLLSDDDITLTNNFTRRRNISRSSWIK